MLESEQVLQERYQLQQKLGRTAAGRQTWLAIDLQSNERVTLKLLAFSPQMQWEEFKLFEREAQVLQALDRPQIPRYRDYFSLDRENETGLPWFGLVQDYIPGESLQEILERGKRFTEQEVRAIATEILNILIYLHELNPPVLHRDIKPSNLILAEDKQVYLVDFGAVQAQAAITGVTFTVVGTSGYAPLEQFWGRAVPASDLYALGATLIHLLTGIAPADLPQKDLRIQFADRVSLNPSFVSWIEMLTEPAIEKRFSTARQALEDLKSGQVLSQKSRSSAIGKIPQPSGDRIKLNKSAERLEIQLSNHGRVVGQISAVVEIFTIAIILFASFVTGWYKILGFLINFFVLLISFSLAERLIVIFDRDSFEIKRQLFCFTYGLQKGSLADIQTIFLKQEIGSTYQVIIRSTNRDYKINRNWSDLETTWLAQEIQDWLNLK